MPRNIEIKARVAPPLTLAALEARAVALAAALPGGAPAQTIEQDDSFYTLPAGRGRLKLRRFADGSAELIHYQRADTAEAKASDYVRVPLPDAAAADALDTALDRANGRLGRVVKRRRLVLVGATRVHLDAVQGLGDFVELEVVLRDDQSDADGEAVAEALMRELGLAEAERLAGAYLDLLAGAG